MFPKLKTSRFIALLQKPRKRSLEFWVGLDKSNVSTFNISDRKECPEGDTSVNHKMGHEKQAED